MRIVKALFLLAVFGLALPGSAAKRQPLVPPQVTVQSVTALAASTPQRFRITLLIDNTNSEPLAIRAVDFKLRLANEGIIDGRASTPITVEALHQETLTLELGSDIVSSLSRLMAFVQGPESAIPYEIYGRVTLNRRMLKELPFATMGVTPLAMQSGR
jgi:LEA14-like dessication related protein